MTSMKIMSNIPVSKHQHHINDDLCPMIFGQINLNENKTSIRQLSTGYPKEAAKHQIN